MKESTERCAVITGSSSGIGQAVARRLAAAGMRICVHYLSSESGARATLESLPGNGHILRRADASDAEQMHNMVLGAAEEFGRLDVLVNNAGIFEPTPFNADWDEWKAGWKRTLDVNLMSAVHCTHAAVQIMRVQRCGKVINVASRSAFRAETDAPAYAVSKAGMVNLTRCLARAEAQNGILSYCIAPGWVETAMARDGMASMASDILSQIPLGRIATCEDVAGVAEFLVSPAADYLTGITIDVNGGSYLH